MKRYSFLFLAIPLAAALFIYGCGGDEGPALEIGSKSSEPRGSDQTFYVPDAEVARVAPEVQMEAATSTGRKSGFVPAAEESWPPEIVVAVSDTVIAPGEIVQVTARGTPDVTEIALWDGLGEKEPFYFDETQRLWKTTYRAPLVSRWERIGLSVTARNAEGRWRRVWAFVRLNESEPASPGVTKLAAGPDTPVSPDPPAAPNDRETKTAPGGSDEPDPDGS